MCIPFESLAQPLLLVDQPPLQQLQAGCQAEAGPQALSDRHWGLLAQQRHSLAHPLQSSTLFKNSSLSISLMNFSLLLGRGGTRLIQHVPILCRDRITCTLQPPADLQARIWAQLSFGRSAL